MIRQILRGIFLKWRNPERYVLEKKIFKRINRKRVLFVGVAPYTAQYPIKLKNNDLTTIDINPYVAKYGAKNHIIGDIGKYFFQEKFDVIFLVGILGYGVDTREKAEEVLKNCFNSLNKNGILIATETLVKLHNPVKLRDLKAYKKFQAIEAFGYGSPTRINKAVFEFLLKKEN